MEASRSDVRNGRIVDTANFRVSMNKRYH
jgi:hypothetical protein